MIPLNSLAGTQGTIPSESSKRAFADMEAIRARILQAGKDRGDAHLALLRQFIAISGVFDHQVLYRAERIGKLASMLAWFAGQPHTYCEMLEQVAPLHEIGSIVLSSAAGDVPTVEEPKKSHTTSLRIGVASLLLQAGHTPTLELAHCMVSALHEKYDGTGLPHALRGWEIPLEARIVALIRQFDELAQDGIRHQAAPTEETCRYFKQESGRSFDPVLVDILLNEWSAFIALREAVNQNPPVRLLSSYGGGGVIGLQELLHTMTSWSVA